MKYKVSSKYQGILLQTDDIQDTLALMPVRINQFCVVREVYTMGLTIKILLTIAIFTVITTHIPL